MAKKKFKDTLVGGGLIGIASLINPTLGSVLQGVLSPGEAIKAIGDSSASPEEKLSMQEFLLKTHGQEVEDRVSARSREAAANASGSSDILFKTIGWTISLAFLGLIATAVGLIDIDPSHQRAYDMAFGAVTIKMGAIVSYYFGSSQGSKDKTMLMSKT